MSKTFCLLTAPGRSAVATTLVCGKGIASELSTLFVSESGRPIKLRLNRPTFGYWSSEGNSREGLVVCMLSDCQAEIHSHGGSLAPRMIGDSLIESGFRQLDTIEYLKNSSSNWDVEIQVALSQATTQRTAIWLLRQSQMIPERLGELKRRILSQPKQAQVEIEQALNLASFGLHLNRPWRIVICGQPNVGKSSLINALSGFTRAIVHDSPGTTRDVVSQVTAIEGWPVELADTAGIRIAGDEIERQGVERALEEARSADLRISLFDASRPWSAEDQGLLQTLRPNLIVHNKADVMVGDSRRPPGLSISATQSQGMSGLLKAIVAALVPNEPSTDQWFPISETQCEKLHRISKLISEDRLQEAATILP